MRQGSLYSTSLPASVVFGSIRSARDEGIGVSLMTGNVKHPFVTPAFLFPSNSVIHWLFSRALFNRHVFVNLPVFSLLISSLVLVVRAGMWYDFSLL